MEKLKKCKECEKILASWNKSGLCSNCCTDRARDKWFEKHRKDKKKYDKRRYKKEKEIKIKNSSCSIL